MRRRLEGMRAGRSAVRSGLIVAVIVACCGAALANDPAPASSAQPNEATRDGPTAEQSANRLLCVHEIAPSDSLPVRSGPGPQRPITGRFPANGCGINLAGSCRGDWCEMALGGVRGWVDTRFIGVYEVPGSPLSQQPVAIAAPATAAESGSRAQLEAPAGQAAQDAARQRSSDQAEAENRAGQAAPNIPQPKVRAGACVAGVARRDTLRMRVGPGARYAEIGGIPSGTCNIERLSGCRSGWCRVTWRGQVGWVNTSFLE